MPTLRSLLNELACLTVLNAVKPASLFVKPRKILAYSDDIFLWGKKVVRMNTVNFRFPSDKQEIFIPKKNIKCTMYHG